MKVICNRAELQTAFQLAASVISSRTIRPIHQNVKMEVEGSAVHLIATDGDVDIRVLVNEAAVKEPGVVLLPSVRIAGILRESSDEEITVETVEGGSLILGADSRFKILAEPPDEFPEVGKLQDSVSFEITGDILKDMILKTAFAAAQDTTRYSLNGVLFTLKQKNLVMVATDGRRMAKVERKLPKIIKKFDDIIVPTKALNEVGRVMPSADETVSVSISEREIIFSSGQNLVAARAVSGTFPRYEDAIPTDCDKKAELHAQQLLSAVRRAALLTAIDARMVKFSFADGKVTLSSSSVEAGEATITVGADMNFESLEIAFNPNFVEEVLRVAEGDVITLEMKSRNTQAIARSGANYLYVIMPVILPE